jgi:uncharacterized protein (DUF2132 family)
MQTFMPYPSFRKSLDCLDNKRLGKQRVEAKQIYNIVKDKRSKGEKLAYERYSNVVKISGEAVRVYNKWLANISDKQLEKKYNILCKAVRRAEKLFEKTLIVTDIDIRQFQLSVRSAPGTI